MKRTVIILLILLLLQGLPAATGETETPADRTTRAYPVSVRRAVLVDNENVKTINMEAEGMTVPYTVYVVPEETLRLRFELAPDDNPEALVYNDFLGPSRRVSELLDPERNEYTYDQATEGMGNGIYYHYNIGILADRELDQQDPDRIQIVVLRDEACLDEVAEFIRRSGYTGDIHWEEADPGQPGSMPGEGDRAYTVRVADQNNEPVPDVYVNFCTDTACVMKKSDGDGMIVFDGAPDEYHIQILRVPEGYSFDAAFELYTDREYGSWALCIRKD